ncbi:MAG: hypothetical protein ACI9GW_000517 [Halieaceae bacterium]|jgi:hypothetical protein
MGLQYFLVFSLVVISAVYALNWARAYGVASSGDRLEILLHPFWYVLYRDDEEVGPYAQRALICVLLLLLVLMMIFFV